MLDEGDYVNNREELGETPEKAKIARACPIRMTVKKGETYLYCTCGHSQFQPFCDGTHKLKPAAKGFKPLKVTVQQEQKFRIWCGCKRNHVGAGPGCDGNHAHIDW
ncbi:hypothetical protein FGO68_gene7978 [Halteria grandinella]|uniref:Iron-binding zinc finger CDGSH type domain-containing protein n=1 Tax=Halteria grandinella TaxID=5974 RepID=A0A8J8NDH8_HALGN|nr:hypothetical protein FGO68_gene7978 [Halteria grandinella]